MQETLQQTLRVLRGLLIDVLRHYLPSGVRTPRPYPRLTTDVIESDLLSCA